MGELKTISKQRIFSMLTGYREVPVFLRWLVLPRLAVPGLVAAMAIWGATATAGTVNGLYRAIVDTPKDAAVPLQGAFDAALDEVLVKVTGLPDAATARTALFPNPGALVQQYRMLPEQQVRVDFDPVAVRKVLDAAGLPVWGAERPLVAVWLAVDTGGGRRYIVSGGAAMDGAGSDKSAQGLDDLRQTVIDSADKRGLPAVLPLVDGADLAAISFADLWGDFTGPVAVASERYAAEAILIGRTRSFDPDDGGVRWTLAAGDEQIAWQGTVASGPAEAASFLARRLATYADSAGSVLVRVTNVDSLAKYGQLNKYLRSLSIVEQAGVVRVTGDSVEFELVVRGDSGRLARALDGSDMLERSDSPLEIPTTGRLPDLVYTWPEAT
jgi:hypothetical protein